VKPLINIAATLTGVLIIASNVASAHHSDSVYFVDDRSDPRGAVKIEGTISRVRLINPHSEFVLDVENDAGETDRWVVGSDSWGELRTLGWTQDTISVGDHVTAIVSMSKFHPTAGRLRDLWIHGATPADNSQIFLEYIPDASDDFGQSSAPLRLMQSAPQCEGTVKYDPGRERGEETLLCMIVDSETIEEFRTQLRLLR